MRQKIDITDVETATKIRAKYLRALENEEFELLHGGTFVRSFLRTYAQYLGLDAHRLLEEYRSRHEPREEVELQPIAPRPQRRRDPRGGRPVPPPPRRGAVFAGLAVALIAFLLVLGLTGDEDDPGDGGEGARQADTQEPEEQPRRREPAREEDREGEEERQEEPERVRVRVSPAAPIYVCWDRGPDDEGNELPALAEARTFRGPRIRLNIGNPSATVTVDGERLDLEGAGPFGFDFRAGREPREIPSGERPCQ